MLARGPDRASCRAFTAPRERWRPAVCALWRDVSVLHARMQREGRRRHAIVLARVTRTWSVHRVWRPGASKDAAIRGDRSQMRRVSLSGGRVSLSVVCLCLVHGMGWQAVGPWYLVAGKSGVVSAGTCVMCRQQGGMRRVWGWGD